MLYVLTLGWVWFAAAGALGLLVGFATATPGRGGEFSGLWGILAAFGVLAGGFAGAELGLVPGRAGLQLEIGLLAALTYFIGLSIGGGAKGLLTAPTAAPMKPTPVVVRGRPRDEERAAPKSSPAPKSAAPAAEPPPAKSETTRSETAPARESTAKASPGKKHFPGHPPESLAAPRGGSPDDLTRIKGIGPKSVEKLHALGVFHFDQIAAWNIDNARWIGAALSAPGRVERGKWIQQARELVAARESSR
jgi:predicted flap endonuclease-1-like 5' DNA nuclease